MHILLRRVVILLFFSLASNVVVSNENNNREDESFKIEIKKSHVVTALFPLWTLTKTVGTYLKDKCVAPGHTFSEDFSKALVVTNRFSYEKFDEAQKLFETKVPLHQWSLEKKIDEISKHIDNPKEIVCIKEIIESDPTIVNKVLTGKWEGYTPLYVAVREKNEPLIKHFLEKKADPNMKNSIIDGKKIENLPHRLLYPVGSDTPFMRLWFEYGRALCHALRFDENGTVISEIQNHYHELVRCFLEEKADIDSKWKTPLTKHYLYSVCQETNELIGDYNALMLFLVPFIDSFYVYGFDTESSYEKQGKVSNGDFVKKVEQVTPTAMEFLMQEVSLKKIDRKSFFKSELSLLRHYNINCREISCTSDLYRLAGFFLSYLKQYVKN